MPAPPHRPPAKRHAARAAGWPGWRGGSGRTRAGTTSARCSHLAVAAGRVGVVSGLAPEQTALTLVYTTMTGSATAAQRLLALDPADVAACTFRLADLCERTATEAAAGLSDLSDPLLDTLAQRHSERERPLFVS